jgi:hypothetical protein
MMYLNALGKGILVINSKRVAVDLLDKRSNIYSDRPYFISAGGFLTQNLSFLLTGYGDLYVVRSSFLFQCSFNIDGAASVVQLWTVSPKPP